HAGDPAERRTAQLTGLVSGDAQVTSNRADRADGTPLPAVSTLSESELAGDAAALDGAWRDLPGIWGWLTAVDHKSIGRRYIITAFLMFLAGGIEAALMRAQLARPENTLLGP